MDILTKRRATAWAIAILIVLNLCALGTVWYQQRMQPRMRPPHHFRKRGRGLARFIDRELNLTPQQSAKVKAQQKNFFDQADVLHREIGELRKEMMEQLLKPSPDGARVDELADEIGAKETQMARLRFAHFQEIKSVCRPEQEKEFEVLIHDVIRKFAPPCTPEGHGPPKDRGRHRRRHRRGPERW
jgi:Spy/CpxP family protein refolding chaperone